MTDSDLIGAGLRWTAWMPLMAAHPLALAQLPWERGLYRIRQAGGSSDAEWIGWADQGVRELAERLSRQVHLPVEPYDDPVTPARALWQLRRDHGVAFDISGVALPGFSPEIRHLKEVLHDSYRYVGK